MKKKINFFSFLFTLIITFSVSQVLAKNTIFNSLDERSLKSLSVNIINNCSSERFFRNLEKNYSYPKFGSKKEWKFFCKRLNNINQKNLRGFFTKNLKIKKNNSKAGLLTGYYEPQIKVSYTKNKVFNTPILKYNKFYENKSRKFINHNYKNDDVLLWTDDYIDLFFLQIQGSGIGVLNSGDQIKINYQGNNRLPYSSIGKILKKQKKINQKKIDLFSIKSWLRNNPEKAMNTMNENKRYIFFEIKENNNLYPSGALGIPLEPNFSIAIDNNVYPVGIPFIIKFFENKKIKIAISQDTGNAIRGVNRADLFTGRGKRSEQVARKLKKKIYLNALIPYSK